MTLKDKIVLVTGSSKGIGKAIAIAFAKQGANVIINFRNSEAEANKTLEEITKLAMPDGRQGGDHMLFRAEMSKEAEVKDLFNKIKAKYGNLDILVNNSGDARSIDPAMAQLSDWEYQLDNNFLSAVLASKEFLNIAGSNSIRKIINISSIWGFDDKSDKDYMAYGASKAAMNSFTKSMAKKYAPKILVNAVAPGYVLTPHWGEMSKEDLEFYGKQQLIERFITTEEIADGVIFLAKNDSMTGTILIMDGGIGLKTI